MNDAKPEKPVFEEFKYYKFPHEEKVTPEESNAEQSSEFVTVHLSGSDGKTVAEASQIIIHKMPKGDLQFEFYPNEYMANFYKIGVAFSFQLTPETRKTLQEFLNNPKTY